MTMLSVFELLKTKLWGASRDSKSKAKSRLQFVLVQDRTGLNNEDMASFKRELVRVIERYFVIDKQGFDVTYQREGPSTTLLINSPVMVRRQDTPDREVGAKPRRRSKNRKKARVRVAAPPSSETVSEKVSEAAGTDSAAPVTEPKIAV